MSEPTLSIPRLETQRLSLRAWHETDVDAMAKVYADEDNCRFVGGVKSPQEVWRQICLYIGHWQWRGFGLWAVERKDTKEMAGWCGLWKPQGWDEAELSYGFARQHQGLGFAFEGALASLKHAYRTLGWKTAISYIDVDNKPSQKLAQRLGAVNEKPADLFKPIEADVWRHLPSSQFLERFA